MAELCSGGSRRVTAPARLGAKARKLWRQITSDYQLRADELRILEEVCREVDLIERLEADLSEGPLMVKGSMGQLTASPLVSELRQHRSTLNALLKTLRLPSGDPAAEERERSDKARAAARARWSKPGLKVV